MKTNILCHYKGQLGKVCFQPLVSFLSLMKIVFMPVLINSYLFRGSMVGLITNINLCRPTNFKIYMPSISNNFFFNSLHKYVTYFAVTNGITSCMSEGIKQYAIT